jgi:hypothetical protein
MKKTEDAIKKIDTIPEKSKLLAGFEIADYCESYRIKNPANENIEEITAQIFNLPKWIKGLMKIRDWMVKPFGLKTSKEIKPGEIFPVLCHEKNEILMGMDDKHLNFRVSVLIDREISSVYITTIVLFNNLFGKIYFQCIKPFHQLMITSIMKRQIDRYFAAGGDCRL